MDLTPYKECPAHKQWIFIANESQTDEFYRPCCYFKTNISANTPVEFYDKLSTMDIETNCQVCIDMEKTSNWSPRILFKNSLHTNKQLVITASFDNLCNLKCITCTPENSTQIASEIIKIDKNHNIQWFNKLKNQAPGKIDFIKQLLSQYEFDTLRFELLGGEPLINPAVTSFIDWLAEQPYAKNIQLIITTNGTTKSPNTPHYIEKFGLLGIQLSVDGVEDTFEYIRSGADYQVLKDTVDYYYNHYINNRGNMMMGFNYTLSWMNSLNFADFIKWLHTDYPELANLHVTKLIGPEHYSIDILSTQQRLDIYNKVMDIINQLNVTNQNILNGIDIYKEHMNATDKTNFDVQKFNSAIHTLNTLDGIRDTAYSKAFNQIINYITE